MHERDILLAALEKAQPAEREAYLAQACGSDLELRSRVDALLQASEVQDSFLEHPAAETELFSRETDGIRREIAGHGELSLDFLQPAVDPDALGRLGTYDVLEVIGRGGMGVVLKARDTKLNRVVAIKVLAPELASNPTARKRFQREAHAAAAVVHQHIVTIHAVEEDRLPFLVMECIVGQSLKEKIDREGQLQLVEILRIGQQVASGLAAAHTHGLIHRDVKPANILLENGVERVRITDFGLARAVDDVGMTRTGEVSGTPQYMSPEQAQGLPMDCRSDLFSLGGVLYAMCTGRPPFRAESTPAVLHRICHDTPRSIQEINSAIPDWLLGIIERLLKKDPAARFQSAREVAELLGQYLAHAQQPAIVPLPGTISVSQKRSPRARLPYWSVAAVATLLVLALGLSLTEASGVTKVMPTVIRVVRGEGTLVIEVDDPTVQVSLDGEALSIRGAGLQELKLTAGKYRLHATKDGQPVKDEVVTVTRNGRKLVTVTLESSSGPGSPSVVPAVEQPVGELKLLGKLDGHSDLVRGVEFLPDGRRMVSVGRDKMVRLWDMETRSILSTLPVEGYLRDADVSADGRLVAMAFTSSAKGVVIHVWNLEKRERICEVVQNGIYINCVRFSPDGTHVVTCGNPSDGVLWNLATGSEVRRFDVNEKGDTSAMEFSPDGRLLAIGATGRVRLFDTESGNVVGDVQLPQSRGVLSLAFSSNGSLLACGQMGGHTSLIDIKSRQVTSSLPNSDPDAHVHELRFTDRDRFLLTTHYDTTLRVWDIERMKVVATAAMEKGTNHRLDVSPDGRYAVIAGGEDWDPKSRSYKPNGDYALRLWQLPESVWPKEPEPTPDDLELLAKFDGHTDVVRAVAFLPDSRKVVSVGRDEMVRIWDVETRSITSTLPVEGYLRDADVSADGRFIAGISNVGAKKGVVQVWDIEKQKLLCELVPDLNWINCIRFSPDGTRVVTSGDPTCGVLWDLSTGKELRRFDIGGTLQTLTTAFSPNGRVLALGAVGRVRLFDVESGDILRDVSLLSNRLVQDVAFTPDGKTFATSQNGGAVSLVDVGSGQVIKTLQGSDAAVLSVRFLRNDQFLLTASEEGTLRVWDTQQGKVVAAAATEKGTNGEVFISPDGRYAVTASGEEWDDESNRGKANGDYALRLWQLPASVWPKASSPTSSSADTTNQTSKPEAGAFGPAAATGGADWVQLFNGHDLTGWKAPPSQPGNWRVENGLLIGSGPGTLSHLYTEQGDFEDFHLRVEAKINLLGNSGVYFRASPPPITRFPAGYEAQICIEKQAGNDRPENQKTGSLYGLARQDQVPGGAGPDEWFTMEIVARGPRITIQVNGVTTVNEFEDPRFRFRKGHLMLQQGSAETVVCFKKIEIKALPQPEAGAFVRLGGKEVTERKFDTLAEAVQSASDDDTIEIRGNGPFVSPPVKIAGTPLTIRAGQGFRPVIRLEAGDSLLESSGTLCLEGLELHVMDLPWQDGQPWPVLVHALGRTAQLFVANCRFVGNKPEGIPIRTPEGAVLEVHNSQFATQGAIICPRNSNCRLVFDNNLMSAPFFCINFPLFGPDVQNVNVDIRRNTLVSPIPFQFALDSMPKALEEHLKQPEKAWRFQTSENLFDGDHSILRFEQTSRFLQENKRLSVAEMESLLRAMVGWRAESNGFPLIAHLFDPASEGTSLPPTKPSTTIADWNALWGLKETQCIQGSIRYAGGNIREKARTAPQALTPEDFRLQSDSIGYRAGSESLDLGADVDLVGPGAAYERWKKTPEYQEWVNETKQSMVIGP